ncbi:MAG: hypothetical protein Kow0074_06460 [Candidatus Zixiibacteriota bacterium]
MQTSKIGCAVICSIILLTFNVRAQAQSSPASQSGTFGVGYQGSWPAHGLSAVYNASPEIGIQGIFGFIGDLRSYYGRILYRFNQKDQTWGRSGMYAYGLAGAFSYPGLAYDADGFGLHETRETVPGFGAGTGWEARWDNNIGVNLELGFSVVSFEDIDYDFSAIMLGAGIHYYFGSR